MSLSKKLRFEIFKRDAYTCRYCGHHPPDVKLEVDHVVPICEGGSNDPANLVTSCFACNRGKSGRGLGESLPPVDEMRLRQEMQEAMERAYDVRASLAAAQEERKAVEEAVDALALYIEQELRCTPVRASLVTFSARLPMDVLFSLVREASSRRRPGMGGSGRWRYFCGICWRVIREASAA